MRNKVGELSELERWIELLFVADGSDNLATCYTSSGRSRDVSRVNLDEIRKFFENREGFIE